jgi:hypothetical protein
VRKVSNLLVTQPAWVNSKLASKKHILLDFENDRKS